MNQDKTWNPFNKLQVENIAIELGFIESEEDRIIEEVEQEVIQENIAGADAEVSRLRIDLNTLKNTKPEKEKEKEEKEAQSSKELEISFKQKRP